MLSWIKERYGFDCVDLITEPGIAGLLIDYGSIDASIIRKINLSLDMHRSEYIFVAGHHDCAAYGGDDR